MKITVFTPAYNRGYTLTRLFDSLCRQSFTDFEWLVIDDGSTDNTKEIMDGLIAKKPQFPVRYVYTDNGGKHRAINKGVKLAEGELFFIVDSDDYIPDDALCIINDVDSGIPVDKKKKMAGLFGLKSHLDMSVFGKTFDGEYLDISSIEKDKYGIRGEKADIYYTDVLREYPFPEFEGEKFSTESIVWDRMSHDGYIYRFFNDNVCFCDYQEDGLTHQGMKLYARNPKQWGLSIHQNYAFKKYNWYNTAIQIYIYHCYLKGTLTNKEMIKLLDFSAFQFYASLFVENILDFCRKALGKTTVKDSVVL